jgi:hypothetical protein
VRHKVVNAAKQSSNFSWRQSPILFQRHVFSGVIVSAKSCFEGIEFVLLAMVLVVALYSIHLPRMKTVTDK